MPVMAMFLVVASVVALATGASPRRLLERRFRWWGLLPSALVVQLVVGPLPLHGWLGAVGSLLLLATYGALLAFCGANLSLSGLRIVALGVALNALVVAVNHGMPVAQIEGVSVSDTVKHHALRPSDRLVFLGDVVVIGGPGRALVSPGDLVLSVGLGVTLVLAGRRRPDGHPSMQEIQQGEEQ